MGRERPLGRLARVIVRTALESVRTRRGRSLSVKRVLRRLAAQDPRTTTRVFADDEARQISGRTYRTGLAKAERNELAAAERCFRHAARRWPSVGWFSYRLASVLLAQARNDEAASIFANGNAMRLGPDLVTDTRILLVAAKDFAALNACEPKPGAPVVAPDQSGSPADALLFLSCDSAYFKLYASAAIASALANSALDLACHVHIVNPDRDAFSEQTRIGQRHSDRRLSFSHESTDLSGRGDAERKVYYACRRFQLLPATLRCAGTPIIVADIDQLVVGSLVPLLSAVREADVGLIEFGKLANSSPLAAISASAVVAAPSPGARRYFDLVAAYVDNCLGRDLWVWHLDQAALFGAKLMIETQREPVRIRRLDPAILESAPFDPEAADEPAPDTVFWSITHSLPANAAKRSLDVFERYSKP